MPFRYEDKHWHSTERRTINASIDQKRSRFKAEGGHFEHVVMCRQASK